MIMRRRQNAELLDHGRKCPLTLSVHERLYQGLHDAAVRLGMTRSQYAQALLEAAHAARHGGTGDTSLEDMVGATLLLYGSKYDTAAIARVLKTTEPQVVAIVQQWKSRPRPEAETV